MFTPLVEKKSVTIIISTIVGITKMHHSEICSLFVHCMKNACGMMRGVRGGSVTNHRLKMKIITSQTIDLQIKNRKSQITEFEKLMKMITLQTIDFCNGRVFSNTY